MLRDHSPQHGDWLLHTLRDELEGVGKEFREQTVHDMGNDGGRSRTSDGLDQTREDHIDTVQKYSIGGASRGVARRAIPRPSLE